MDQHLKKLMKLMPPPAKPKKCKVNWERLEDANGTPMPLHFQEFIAVYGMSRWFDDFTPFYTTTHGSMAVYDYRTRVHEIVDLLEETEMEDENGNKIVLPVYETDGGMFPFMTDKSENVYCWLRQPEDEPEKWPLVCWFQGKIVILENTTLAKFFCDLLERKPGMVELFYDVAELPAKKMKLRYG